MIHLAREDYNKVLIPLNQVKINRMFAEAVIRKTIPGNVYVDCLEDPHAFYVLHPYGMSLLFGESGNEDFNRELVHYITNKKQKRLSQEWLQADPAGDWIALIDSVMLTHNDSLVRDQTIDVKGTSQPILRNTRVNFRFNSEAYRRTRKTITGPDDEIVQITKGMFMAQPGSVTARNFWRDEEHFLAEGIGYSLLSSGDIASTAFSAFIDPYKLEIGIETSEGHRGKGYAYAVCAALIDYCLEHQLEPVWSCRLENEGSYKLAQRLGFEPSLTLPYYRLAE
ncbi:GNAT family N-acetyltransferase [Paenibacillus sp. sgz500958]|uniref:GNAT family N-acetyltransferase n=1 Tax=Paenibacillus sp. sgz500958 TaxID=3242475 RepID=UPI0036D271C2